MARRRDPDQDDGEKRDESVKVSFSPVNEQVVIAACLLDAETRARLTQVLRPESFLVEQHRPVWVALSELARKGLAFDWATLEQVAGPKVDCKYLRLLADKHPTAPSAENLHHHVQAMAWDRRKAIAVQGPLTSLLEALKDPIHPPERVGALARHVSESLSGAGKSYVRESGELVGAVVDNLRRRQEGHACWAYGIEGLDRFEEGARNRRGDDIGGRHRMLPGAAPGQVTVLTAVSGGGKSTFAAHMALGLARQERRVTYAAWEPGGEVTLEVLAVLSLGWSRADVTEGRYTGENIVEIEERCHAISHWVRFMENPFQRVQKGKESNERNLDLVHQHIVDTGCEVFIADLWDRCLVNDDPSEEKRALLRQQAMAFETRTHHILLAQQRMKDIELREDKRPTREGIKGSSAWVDIADTILAPHLPGMFKDTPDQRMEVIVWKQRHGQWPLAVEFDWDGEFGSIANGRTVEFRHIGEAGGEFEGFRQPDRAQGQRKRRSRA